MDAKRVVLMVDGMGSSSAGLYLGRVGESIEHRFEADVCIFNYAGFDARFYYPEHTVLVPFEELLYEFERYVQRYRSAEQLVLIGYSKGGLVVREYLWRKFQSGTLQPNVVGCCLIASPISLNAFAHLPFAALQGQDAARSSIEDLVATFSDTTGMPFWDRHTLVCRSERDGLLPDCVYEPAPHPLMEDHASPRTTHASIIAAPSTQRYLMKWLPTVGIPRRPQPAAG